MVTASNQQCNITSSHTASLQSVPCVPSNVSVVMDCANNIAVVSWSASRGAVQYSVTARGSHSNDSCQTSGLNCSLNSLTCGSQYTVEVVAISDSCSSIPSQAVLFKSGPCPPHNVSAQISCVSNDLLISWDVGIRGSLDCVTNSASISWDAASGADSYFVSAVGGDDHTTNCTTSTNTTCKVVDLACGVLYNFSVTAKNSKCESQPSTTINLQTAPCSLSAITAFPQCHNGSILVMWDRMKSSDRNTVYRATAEASDQTLLHCNNTGTSCYLTGAQCDLHYTISVSASSDECSSMRSPPYRVSMEPCPPRDVRLKASCEDHTALVSWTPSPVAETYHVVAMAADGHMHTCNTTFSNCSVSELHCDQQYTVYVTASHENCTSKRSQNTTLNTGPCQPSRLSVTFHCTNQSAVLTWTPSGNAQSYYGWAQGGNGDMLYCHTSNLTCTIEGLVCGTLYNFSVQASDGTCNSSLSDPVQSRAVPCPPDAIRVQPLPMQMDMQVMRFSWTQVSCGNTEYMLHLTGELLGDNQTLFNISSCWTSRTFFEVPLPCSSSYVATVRSGSDKSLPLVGKTAPCPPSGVVYRGNSSFATVSWNASVFATEYTVYDVSVLPRVQICSSTGLSCSLTNIAPRNLVVTASNGGGESEGTNITNVVPHARRRRDLSEQSPMNAPVLDIKQPVPTAVFIEWSKVEAASYYTILIKKQGSSSEVQEMTIESED
ncbi:fibronectin type III domain-containing protein 7-like [Parambassis ranga]|uniref:Fibronectin type III domain-containing protein 7-like n=1 Tax=Parambassis ranga TaxID=210632 RepID=A0A6P7K1X6_9TELE|nr:fibronectin type III domain-containing protein 7-like [Parambassis ranga]